MILSEIGNDIFLKEENIARIFDIEVCSEEILKTVKRKTNQKAILAVKTLEHINRRILEKSSVGSGLLGDPTGISIKISQKYVSEEVGATSRQLERVNALLNELNFMTPLNTFMNEEGFWQHVWRINLRKYSRTKLVAVNRLNLSTRTPTDSEMFQYEEALSKITFVKNVGENQEIISLDLDHEDLLNDPEILSKDVRTRDNNKIRAEGYLKKRSILLNSMNVDEILKVWDEHRHPTLYPEGHPRLLEIAELKEDSDLDFEDGPPVSDESKRVFDKRFDGLAKRKRRQLLNTLIRC